MKNYIFYLLTIATLSSTEAIASKNPYPTGRLTGAQINLQTENTRIERTPNYSIEAMVGTLGLSGAIAAPFLLHTPIAILTGIGFLSFTVGAGVSGVKKYKKNSDITQNDIIVV